MEALYPDFVAFRDRLANRLMALALDCQDTVTQQKLMAIASELRERTDPAPEGESAAQDRITTIHGWRHQSNPEDGTSTCLKGGTFRCLHHFQQ